MNGHDRQGFHLVITSIEEFTAFVALIRGDASASPAVIAALTKDAQRITEAGTTLGEAADTLDRVSPDPPTT
jgi:hypothetical protein